MCYLPTTLVVLALMIRLHDRTDRQLRIQAGLAGYIAALVAVPVVSAMPDSAKCLQWLPTQGMSATQDGC